VAGRYILMVRGYRQDGHFADSSVVLLDVVARANQITGRLADILPAPVAGTCPSLEQLASAFGISVPDLLALNPGLRATAASLPLACNTSLTLPRPVSPPPGLDRHHSDETPSPSPSGTGTAGGTGRTTATATPSRTGSTGGAGRPTATHTPSGTGSTGGTASTATLSAPESGTPGAGGATATPGPVIGPPPLPDTPSNPTWINVDPTACTSVNLSWNAVSGVDGYTLYRRAPGDSHLNLIAHLPASQTHYTDSLAIAGAYYYQVAAVRSGHEGLSSTQYFNTLDFPACAAMVPSRVPSVAGILYLIMPSLQTNIAYEGVYCYLSLDGGAQGRLPAADFSSLTPLSDGLSYDMRIPPAGGVYMLTNTGVPVTVELRCMGRRGVYSDSLGGFVASHPSTEWDGRVLSSSGTGGTGAFTVQYCITPDPTHTPCATGMPVASGISVPYVPNLPMVPITYAADLPAPTNLRLENGITACDEIADARGRGACVLSLLVGGVPQLAWDWTGIGPYNENTLTGYHVVAQMNGSPWRDWDVHPGSRKLTLASTADLPCGTTVTFQVTAVQGDLQSPASEPFSYATSACVNAVRLQVTFNTLTLGPSPSTGQIYDAGDICIGDCPTNQFEIVTFMGVYPFVEDSTGHVAYDPSIMHQGLVWQGYATGEGFTRVNVPATIDFASQQLGQPNPDVNTGWPPITTGMIGNNVIVLDSIRPDQSLMVTMEVDDVDALLATSVDCVFSFRLPARSFSEWASLNQTLTATDDSQVDTATAVHHGGFFRIMDNLGCSVNATVTGQPLR
jgi:hypothetical protein